MITMHFTVTEVSYDSRKTLLVYMVNWPDDFSLWKGIEYRQDLVKEFIKKLPMISERTLVWVLYSLVDIGEHSPAEVSYLSTHLSVCGEVDYDFCMGFIKSK